MLSVGLSFQKGKDMIRIQGVDYSYSDINAMSEYLVANEGFYSAPTFPSADVVYWVEKLFPGGTESFLAMGKVDTSKLFVGWISYTSQNTPGNQSFELEYHNSLQVAKEFYTDFCETVGTDDCTMTLYYTHKGHEGLMVKAAEEFRGVGCPFDHPDRVIMRGPRGGVRIENT